MTENVEEKIYKFFKKYPARVYSKGETVIFAGEDLNQVFYLTKGKVRQYDISYRGDEIVVNVFMPGSFFPMSSALTRIKNTYFFKTETASEVHVIPASEAVKFVESNPDILLDLLTRLYRGMEGVLGRMVHLISGTARSRILYELMIECKRFGDKTKEGYYRLSINEGDLAARSGLSRETVSREMHSIQAEGLARVENKGIRVEDLLTLEKKLGFET